MPTLIRLLAALALVVTARPVLAHDGDLRFARLFGGGPRADDCLAAVDVAGVEAAPRARTVVCQDGDTRCDRDRLVNGRCELWVRVCLNTRDPACAARPVVQATVVPAAGDRDLTILGRTLERPGDAGRRGEYLWRFSPPSPSRSARAATAARARAGRCWR